MGGYQGAPDGRTCLGMVLPGKDMRAELGHRQGLQDRATWPARRGLRRGRRARGAFLQRHGWADPAKDHALKRHPGSLGESWEESGEMLHCQSGPVPAVVDANVLGKAVD